VSGDLDLPKGITEDKTLLSAGDEEFSALTLPPSLGERIKGVLHLRIMDVRIDHGGGEVGVPEHHLTLRGLRAMMESEVAT